MLKLARMWFAARMSRIRPVAPASEPASKRNATRGRDVSPRQMRTAGVSGTVVDVEVGGRVVVRGAVVVVVAVGAVVVRGAVDVVVVVVEGVAVVGDRDVVVCAARPWLPHPSATTKLATTSLAVGRSGLASSRRGEGFVIVT